MINSIYGLNYECISNPNPCLTFTKNSKWLEIELNEIEKKMLISCPIPRLLPMKVNEMDLQISLSYPIGAKITLEQWIERQPLNEMECFQVLFGVVTAIMESKTHLLNEANYLLQKNFIYIGADCLDVNLIYIPINLRQENQSIIADLLKLSQALLLKPGYPLSIHANRLMQLFNANETNLNPYKELLIKAITESVLPIIATDYSTFPVEEDLLSKSLKPSKPAQSLKYNSITKTHNPALLIVCLSAIILIVVLLVKFPSIGMFNLGFGLSLLLINSGIMLNKSLQRMDTNELTNSFSLGNMNNNQIPLQSDHEYYNKLSNLTTILTPTVENSDATVLLAKPLKPFLELKQDEETEWISINQTTFIIGRSKEAAQYVMNWMGLSRTHLEISQVGNTMVATDLGSKNGSYINEEAMVPHEAYPLNEGDCLKIVGKQFIFKKI